MRPRARLRAQFGAPSVDKALGALPVVADLCRRLDLAGVIDRACPVREVALVTHGQVIEALVANRLTSPTPLVHVQDWASQWAVWEVWGIDPAVLNDDRIGRALDAIAPALEQIVGSVGARAIGVFGLDVARLHWDLTSISLYGAYPDPDVGFITPASKTYVPTCTFAALDPQAATPVDYLAVRDQHKPEGRREGFRVIEDTMTLAGKAKRDPVLTLRRVLVWSSARAKAAQTNRARKLERARDDLGRLQRGLGSRHYPDQAAVAARVRAITTARKLHGVLKAEVGTDPAGGKPTLSWHFDQHALDAQARTDGWYALLSSLDPAEADAAEVLRRYKGQEVVERRYGSFKGPLAVAPLFLKDNRRIAALITVICLALLVFCLVERQVRLAIAPADKLDGLWAHRPAKPTSRLIFTALARLRLTPASGTDPPIIPRPPPLQ